MISTVVGLWLLGVRDMRCIAVAFLWLPVLSAVQTGNLTLLLDGGVGLLWHLRRRAIPLGLVAALLVTSKLFLWPVMVWLLVTRRFRAFAWSSVSFLVLNAAAWVALDAGSPLAYARLLRRLTESEAWDTYTVSAVLDRVGLPATGSTLVELAVILPLLVAWWRRRADERAGLAIAVVVAIIVSPIVWLHYLALLMIPIALVTPRLDLLWLLPLCAVVCPGVGSGTIAQAAVGVTVIVATGWLTAWAALRRPVRPGGVAGQALPHWLDRRPARGDPSAVGGRLARIGGSDPQ